MSTTSNTPIWLITASLALVGGATGSMGRPVFAVVSAIAGALWGLGLAWVARLVQRSERRGRKWTNVVLFVAILLLAVTAGASFMAQLLSAASLTTNPQFFTEMIRGSIGVAEALPFYLFNTPLEWLLLPSVVLFAWSQPRIRTLLVAALVIWTLHRVWTYMFFVPQIVEWSQGTVALTAEQLARARTWVGLSWVRNTADIIVAILLMLVAFATGPLIPALDGPLEGSRYGEGGR